MDVCEVVISKLSKLVPNARFSATHTGFDLEIRTFSEEDVNLHDVADYARLIAHGESALQSPGTYTIEVSHNERRVKGAFENMVNGNTSNVSTLEFE